MSGDSQQESGTSDSGAATPPRRRLLVAAALAPVLAGVGTVVALAEPGETTGTPQGGGGHGPVKPVPTTLADWKDVSHALGRTGELVRGVFYHTRFPRSDLKVVSYGVEVSPGLALGSHMGFVRYTDHSCLVMGDLNVTEKELQGVLDALTEHGIAVTALHKHLLSHSPDVWWCHIHGHGHDAAALARGLRVAMDRTASPPARPPGRPSGTSSRPGLDVSGIEEAMGVKGSDDGGIFKCVFARREPIIDRGRVLPPGLGATSAFNFQALGGGRAALNGDFAMVADEVQEVLTILRKGGISLVEVHNHGLYEEPRLFFTHLWAVDDAVKIAEALRPALDVTNVDPVDSEREKPDDV
ncbi:MULTISPECIES: DUF1259 domain-containing protein [unclassified Streptomyces]|uniref:DUF1259 domain-containing protein n=1 Tax=unclassified Streptomyces TaxID=2593676 RepID=UPI00081DD48D|nr:MULTISPECIES: DUF1259 domain-containing protein [unclassified Streptomyces]MYZ35813.1 DUF1259 domain-containing protein [Streptomyces sp. SID4917]SCF78550.1 protein of unknown function [Streptomyces sp. MnatMP-M17]